MFRNFETSKKDTDSQKSVMEFLGSYFSDPSFAILFNLDFKAKLPSSLTHSDCSNSLVPNSKPAKSMTGNQTMKTVHLADRALRFHKQKGINPNVELTISRWPITILDRQDLHLCLDSKFFLLANKTRLT